MSCIAVTLSRAGGSLVSLEKASSCFMTLAREGGLLALLPRVGGADMSLSRAARMTCRMALVCGTNLGTMYLYASDGILITIDNGYLIVRKMANGWQRGID